MGKGMMKWGKKSSELGWWENPTGFLRLGCGFGSGRRGLGASVDPHFSRECPPNPGCSRWPGILCVGLGEGGAKGAILTQREMGQIQVGRDTRNVRGRGAKSGRE